MNKQQTMHGQDTILGSQASAYVTIGKSRYLLMQLKNFKAEAKISIKEIGILGRTGKAHKAGPWNGTWSASAYYNQSIFRKMMLEYKRTGIMPYFDIQVVNEDESSSVGRQTVILKECLFEGGILAQMDADAEVLEEDISGTFDDFEIPEQFKLLEGMKQ